ncbi:MAG: hypothetical protein NVS3B3_13280 [Aquirhabdus sp.]
MGSCGNVEEGNLIRTLIVIAAGDFDWIASIANIQKLHTFHHATIVDIKAGDNTFSQHIQKSNHTNLENQAILTKLET